MSKPLNKVEVPVYIDLDAIAEAISDEVSGRGVTYENIVEFVLMLDAHMADSVFTELLKKGVNGLD